jgi:hypothetical protein
MCSIARVKQVHATALSVLPLVVAVAYLATLALGYIVLKGRPIVGGIAAVVALVAGRALQIYLTERGGAGGNA